MLATHAIPQAGRLWSVVCTLEAVRRGATTPDAVGRCLGVSPRQGAYYLRAAWSLGLLAYGSWADYVVLTPPGRALVDADSDGRRRRLRRLLARHTPTQAVLAALRESGGLTLDEIAGLLRRIAPLAASTAQRRAQTIAAWLCAVDLARWQGGCLQALGQRAV